MDWRAAAHFANLFFCWKGLPIKIIVQKFGGSSVRDAARLRGLAGTLETMEDLYRFCDAAEQAQKEDA